EDFRIAMRVFAKTLARFDHVVVDDTQGAEPHVVRIKITAEGKAVAAVQPAQLSLAARGGGTLHYFHFASHRLIQCRCFHETVSGGRPASANALSLGWPCLGVMPERAGPRSCSSRAGQAASPPSRLDEPQRLSCIVLLTSCGRKLKNGFSPEDRRE